MSRKRRTPKAWLKRYFRIILGGTVILIMVLFSALGPCLTDYNPYQTNSKEIFKAPSEEHILGTDAYGRDYFTRIAYGGRTTIIIAIVAQLLILMVGTVLGMLCGYYRAFDNVCSRIMETLHCIPNMLLVLMIASLIGDGYASVILALLLSGVVGITRNLRGQVLSIRKMEYIEAEVAMGASPFRTIFLHIMPQTANYLVIRFTTGISGSVLTIASLSYLGVGLSPEIPNWGEMISSAQVMMLVKPYLVIWPGLCIMLVVFGFSMMGEGLRDILDPKYK